MSNFRKIGTAGAKLFHADGRTDLTKLIDAFRNFANAPKNAWECVSSYFTFWTISPMLTELCMKVVPLGGHLSAVRFNSLHSYTNMADARTCQVGSAPPALSVGFSNNVL